MRIAVWSKRELPNAPGFSTARIAPTGAGIARDCGVAAYWRRRPSDDYTRRDSCDGWWGKNNDDDDDGFRVSECLIFLIMSFTPIIQSPVFSVGLQAIPETVTGIQFLQFFF